MILALLESTVRNVARRVESALLPTLADGTRPASFEEMRSGAFLHRVLMDAYGDLERRPWALERVARVAARLQSDRSPADRLGVEILWIPEVNAFTTRGPWIYVSRRFLERCADDETLAFVVAHEMAHHDLDHHAGPLGIEWLRFAEKWAASPEQEAAADAHALRLCRGAGYDPWKCLRALDLMEEAALDWGDREAVFGSDREIAAALEGEPEWRMALERWLFTRRRGYPSIRERKAALQAACRGMSDG